MRIVVTGGSGRIGTYVVRELVQAGHEVTNLDVTLAERLECRGLRVDLTDTGQVYPALAGAEAVVHLGAWANAGKVPDPRTYGDNVTGTFNVFQAGADLGIRRIVSASSAQVYGFAQAPPVYVPADEDHPLRPVNCYALSKIAGEQAAAYFGAQRGLEILSFRFMGVRTPAELGPEVERLAQHPDGGTSLLWTRTDARDAAWACRLAVEAREVEPGPYNITGAQVVLAEPSRELVKRYCSEETEIRAGLDGRASPLSCGRAAAQLGYHVAEDGGVDDLSSVADHLADPQVGA